MSLSAPFFSNLSVLFVKGAASVSDFSVWVDQVTQQLAGLSSWENLKATILGWFPRLVPMLAWFGDWWNFVWAKVETWWLTVQPIVQGWINTATLGLSELMVAWNNFWRVTFPTLINWEGINTWWNAKYLEVETSINSAFTEREGLWSGWQDIRDNVVTFFQDPLGFLEKKFTDWFLGGA
ncbi:MAG: hypothetical protein V1849_01090 [Chloroflexota bacterium]